MNSGESIVTIENCLEDLYKTADYDFKKGNPKKFIQYPKKPVVTPIPFV
jgi:hypothetical protein